MASDTPILTDAAAAEIEQRANAATKGPWIVAMDGFWVFRYVAGEHYKQIGAVAWDNAGRTPQAKKDATFWAAARTDIPTLLADRRARIEELAAVTAERDAALVAFKATDDTANQWLERALAEKVRADAAEAALAAREVEVAAHRELLDDCLTELDCNCKPWLQRKCTRCCVKAALTPPTNTEKPNV